MGFPWQHLLKTMRLLRLSLQNFRNYVRLEEEIPAGAVLLVGQNAQGKTSLLEAVYYLATFASFHARYDREIVNYDAERWGYRHQVVGRIVAEFRREGEPRNRKMEVRLVLESNGNGERLRREVLLDGVKKKLSEAVGVFNAVLFVPQMTEVVTGSPEVRRRYLDMVLAQVKSEYARRLSEYNQTLSRRNALLKLLNEQGGDVAQLDYWDTQLAAAGAQLMLWRAEALEALERRAHATHWELTGKTESLRLCYEPSYNPAGEEKLPSITFFTQAELEAGFVRALQRRRNEEIARGVTTIGPHRDNFRFQDGRRNLGVYGSRGQVRTAMLSLKLAEIAWMKDATGFTPVLLLDEILAELDSTRRADLQAHLAHSEQMLLTTTDLTLFDAEFVKNSTVWRLDQGRVIHA